MSARKLLMGVFAGLVGFTVGICGDDKVGDIIKGEMVGVNSIKKGTEGQIESLVVIGRAALPKGLPEAKAKEVGAKAAERSARAAFSKFLNTEVEFKETATGETTLVTKGEASGESAGQGVSSSQVIDKSSEAYAAVTKSAQAGLQQIGAGVNNGTFVSVYGWKASDTIALIKVSKTMKDTAVASVRDANTLTKARVNNETSPESSSEKSSSSVKSASDSKDVEASKDADGADFKKPGNISSSSPDAGSYF